jgi:hypothetical protein
MKPIILKFAESRITDGVVNYIYDFVKSLNVISVGGKETDFIDSNSPNISLLTETKADHEGADSDFNNFEFLTVTRASREQDDNSDILLELKTKTFTSRERDDESIDYI